MTTAMPRSGLRARQVAMVARLAVRATTWQPLAIAMVGGLALVATGSRASVVTRMAIAGAAVAAGTAFALDDPAAVTLAPSPTSRLARRLMRVGTVVLATGLWWATVAGVAASRVHPLPWRSLTVQLAVFVAVALAVSATAASLGDRTDGGVAGAVVVLGCYVATFLPPRWWLPFPASPNAPGAPARHVAILAVATTVLVVASRDPASRRTSSW